MRFNKLSIGAAVLAGAVLALSAGAAQADEHWDHRDRWEHHHDRYRDHYVHERPVIVHERAPVYVERERPVYMVPPVVYPTAPQGPSGLNLNFNIPLN
jgi:hypothetical protein